MDDYSTQILHSIDAGFVMLDAEMRVRQWSRWMEQHSGIPFHAIMGRPISEFYPEFGMPPFSHYLKAVERFGNTVYLSHKLHGYVFPFKVESRVDRSFGLMRQDCSISALRDEEDVIRYVCISVFDATETAACEERLMELNMRDGLTGAYNRKFLEARLKEEFERLKRYGNSISVVMLDVDHFKRVNDTYGHQFGDVVLKAVSARVRENLRATDSLVRYGGEEFCCLLYETEAAGAAVTAERLRVAVEAMGLSDAKGAPVRVTISLGVSGVGGGGCSVELIKRADGALYEAKRSGRNKVEVADPRDAEPAPLECGECTERLCGAVG